jgi:hypothetical protein
VPTSCQPPAGWGSEEPHWPGTIRDISNGGLALVLKRRFERGAGLALQLPGDDPEQPSTVLVRVIHVRYEPGGLWVLGCAFVSKISDEELAALLRLTEQPAPAPESPKPAAAVFAPSGKAATRPALTEVLCRLALADGRVLRWHIKRLWRAGSWPPAPGARMALRVASAPAGTPALPVTIRAWRREKSGWALDCASADPGAARLLQSCCTAGKGPLG